MASNEFTILEEVVALIEPINIDGVDYAPQFDYGSNEDLVKYIRIKRRVDGNTYPLIWLETPYSTSHHQINWRSSETKLILATNSDQNTLNKERMLTTFKLVLLPLVEGLKKAVKRHNSITSEWEYDLTYHFNYGVENNEKTDIWDALVLTVEFKFKNC